MNPIVVILGAELRALRNRLLKRGVVRLVLLGLGVLFAVVFVVGGAFAVGATIGHFLPAAEDPILAGGFTALSVLMLVIGFPTVIATFFVGRDLLQLVLAPVRPVEVFVARLALAMTANLFISCILLAGVLGIGAGGAAPPVYYPLAIVLVIAQVLLITSVQALLMSVVLKFVPARVARDVAAATAGLAGAGVYLAWNLTFRRNVVSTTRPDVSNLTSLSQRLDWLPSAWPGHALSAAIQGQVGAAAIWTAMTATLAALTLTLAALLYSRSLLAGLGVFGGTPVIWRRRQPARRQSPAPARGAGSPTAAITRKDWLAIRRDIRRLSRLLPALLFPIGYAFALSQPSRGGGGFWTEVFLVTFMSMFMSTALATPAIPSERRGFLLLRMAPLTMSQVLRAKVLLTLPPVLLLTFVFALVVGIVGGGTTAQVTGLALLVLWLGVGFVTIGVSAGAVDPRFDAVDDRRGVGLLGTLTSLVGSLAFAVASVGAFALFVFGAEAAAGTVNLGFLPSTPLTGTLMIAGGILLAALAASAAWILAWFGSTRLSAFEAPIAAT